MEEEKNKNREMEEEEDVAFETIDWSCCCCSRRRGIQVLGGSFLVLALVALVMCAIELSGMPQRIRMARVKADTSILTGVQALLLAQATLAATGAAAAALLLWGTVARVPWALLPWIVCAGAQVALLAFAGVYCAWVAMTRVVPVMGMHGFFVLVVLLLVSVPVLYCLLAVATFYREMRGLEKVKHWQKVAEAGTGATGYGELQPGRQERPGTPPPPPPLAVVPPTLPVQPPPPPRTRYGSDGHENPSFEVTAF